MQGLAESMVIRKWSADYDKYYYKLMNKMADVPIVEGGLL